MSKRQKLLKRSFLLSKKLKKLRRSLKGSSLGLIAESELNQWLKACIHTCPLPTAPCPQDNTKRFGSRKKDLDSNFELPENYQSRSSYTHFDDSANEDEWQLEVYLHAYMLMARNGYSKVIDIGCGSAYKLITYFSQFQTEGYDLPEVISHLKLKYPNHTWYEIHASQRSLTFDGDVIICADVLEHLVDPSWLLASLSASKFKYLVFSTPDRDLLHVHGTAEWLQPPVNPAHVREWTFDEFGKLLGSYFKIVEHKISNYSQRTQMLVCTSSGPNT